MLAHVGAEHDLGDEFSNFTVLLDRQVLHNVAVLLLHDDKG